nr:MAG TPA: hypothetical protein [Caudoviricetes sp.]
MRFLGIKLYLNNKNGLKWILKGLKFDILCKIQYNINIHH